MKVILQKLKNMFGKIIKKRNILLISAVFVVFFLILSVFVVEGFNDTSAENSSTSDTELSAYIQNLENKLEDVIENVSGAGKSNVLITCESGFEYVYAKDEETKTTHTSSGDVTSTSSSVVLVSGEPIIEKEVMPKIKGVVIVCEGAKDLQVKVNILNIALSVLDVDGENILITY